MRNLTFPRPRALALVVLLLLTLGLVGGLAFEAVDAARSQRATAEGALRDYAAFAAWEFGREASMRLGGRLERHFGPVLRPAGTRPPRPVDPARLLGDADASECGCPYLDSVAYAFRLDLRSGELTLAGGDPGAVERAWITDSLAAHARDVYEPSWRASYRVRGERVVAYTVVRDSLERVAPLVYGIEAPRSSLGEPLLGRVMASAPLLPPTLTGGESNDSLLTVVVTDDGGRTLYSSGLEEPGSFAAEHVMDEGIGGGLRVRAALRPARAETLIIGGLPRSRLPLLGGLLALTLGLLVMLGLQFRREHELARLRSDFVSGVSHELRTPLAQIRMFGETLMLGRARSAPDRVRAAEIIVQESRRLGHLVENVLHFSRAERGAARVAPRDEDVSARVAEAVELFAPLARSRRVVLRTELEADIVAPVDADALRQMLLNLLDNALKYGPAGQTITVGLEHAAGRARIRVDDEGPGIPPGERGRVFEAFARLARDTEGAAGGSGIGLSVVRQLARQHGGDARVEEAPGGGARLVVELPGAVPAPPRAAPATPPVEATA